MLWMGYKGLVDAIVATSTAAGLPDTCSTGIEATRKVGSEAIATPEAVRALNACLRRGERRTGPREASRTLLEVALIFVTPAGER